MAFIDEAVLLRLLETRLDSIAGVAVRHQGEPETDDVPIQCRLLGFDLNPHKRQRNDNDETDTGDFTADIEVAVAASETDASVYAIASATAIVRKQLDEQCSLDAPTTHQLDVLRARVSVAREPDLQRGVRTAVVTIDAKAIRTSGTSLENHLT